MKNPSFLDKSISYKSARISQCWPGHVQISNHADTKAWNAISKDAETGAGFWGKNIVHQGVIFTSHFAHAKNTQTSQRGYLCTTHLLHSEAVSYLWTHPKDSELLKRQNLVFQW